MRKTTGRRFPLTAVFLVVAASMAFISSTARGDADSPVTPEVRQQVIEALCDRLEEIYVIPETADRLQEMLRQNLAAGAYDDADSRQAFAAAVTADMQELSRDVHLRLMESERLGPGGGVRRVVRRGPGPGPGDGPGDGGVFDDAQGIVEAKMLEGNVGYIDIRMFMPLEREQDKAVQAMETIAGADALIFDVRTCVGGTPDMVHFVTSYLYPPEPFHLLTYHHGHEPPNKAYTLAEVPGRRLPGADVFILASELTGSGCEEFTYVLKHHGRATVVGSKTAGAGHGGGVHPVAAGFHAFVPDFRPVHPVTGGGWEAVGVLPDLEVESSSALLVAHKMALEALVTRGARPAAEVEPLIASLEAKLAAIEDPPPFDADAHAEYAGTYEIRSIYVEEDGIYLQRQGGPRLRMLRADAPDTFTLERVPQAKIRFGRGEGGAIETLHVLAMTGQWEMTRRQD